jgi:hypothetical protein
MRAMANLAMAIAVVLFVFGVLAFPSAETNAITCTLAPCVCVGCDTVSAGSCESVFSSVPTCLSSCECMEEPITNTSYCCLYSF